MAEAIIMPRQGQSVESCIITKWHKKEGDQVNIGDLLFTYETDKATFDEEAKAEGILLKILRFEDDDVPCLENVCIIGQKGEDISSLSGVEENNAEEKVAEQKTEEKAQTTENVAQNNTPQKAEKNDNDFIKISPRAKNLANKLGIGYENANATGAEGRIIERDIQELTKDGVISLRNSEKQITSAEVKTEITAPANTPYTDEKLSNMRKIIAKSMFNSLQTTAQLTHTASFDATEIMQFRKKIKPLVEKGELCKISLNDIVMYVVSRMLTKHKIFNAHMLDDKIRYFNNVNLAMAVDTKRGLMVPVCFNAEKKSLTDLATELKELATSCQNGSISPDLLSGGSFTVSNLGIFGTESFTPVINTPQTGILGVNTIITRVKEVNGEIKTYPCMTLSLTYDHRAVDGVGAAKFLQDICKSLENFTVTLAKYC